jgi:hypothetical protein
LSEFGASLRAMTLDALGHPVFVPAPLGYCASCTSRGQRRPATALLEGTGRCDPCLLELLHVDDVPQVQHQLRQADGQVEENRVIRAFPEPPAGG